MIKRAQESGVIAVSVYNIRDYADDKHQTTDDRPFGGGPGMVLKALPVLRAIESALTRKSDTAHPKQQTSILITSPSGTQFTNAYAETCSKEYSDIIIVAGRYEGIDTRVKQVLEKKYDVEEVSIGEYVLTGGELPALVIVDAIARRLPGVLGNNESLEEARTASSEMYTRPEKFEWGGEEYSVPEVLRSGNHAEIEKWRKSQNKNG